MMLMFLEGATQDRLAILAKDRGATFRARGFAATDSSGRLSFEPSRCVFVHRLPAVQQQARCADDRRTADGAGAAEGRRRRARSVRDPDRPCPGFKPNELSFNIATPFTFDRGRDKSQPFYAVILKSAPICSLNDAERLRAQKVFPRAKVFLHRYFCEDFGDKVTYSNVNEKSGFVAVYAGDIRGRGAAAARAGEGVRLSGRQHPPHGSHRRSIKSNNDGGRARCVRTGQEDRPRAARR